MADFKVGDEVFVQEGGWGRSGNVVSGRVTKVARVNVTVKRDGTWGRESAFRKDTGIENSPSAKEYPQGAAKIFTPEEWAKREERKGVWERVAEHRKNWGVVERSSTDDLIRLADLLDEIAQSDPLRSEVRP